MSAIHEGNLREDLALVTRKVAERGWAPGSSGNTSLRIPGTDTILIKATNEAMTWTRADTVLKIDSAGNVIAGSGKPSKEYRFHLGIYTERSDIGAIIHAHPPYATSWAIAGRVFPLVTSPSKAWLKKIVIVPPAPGGSPELAKSVIDAYADETIRVILLQGHGLVAAASTIFEAFNFVDWAEDAARAAVYTALIENLSKT
jgi:ribulose-5-phosphate 4-epimerase/fuculose-1-phosphate aldolase